MNTTQHLSKTLLVTSIAAAMALSSTVTFAQNEDGSELKTYTDPISGELKEAPRLLSEMSEAEKAILTEEEKEHLKDIEAQIRAAEQEENK